LSYIKDFKIINSKWAVEIVRSKREVGRFTVLPVEELISVGLVGWKYLESSPVWDISCINNEVRILQRAISIDQS